MTMLSSSTSTKPDTEISVSMIDHERIVSPILRPKYSLTNQNPASLTWLKNSDPEPIARTSSEVLPVDIVAARGARIPEAVIVATVADPVASRIRTATNQASS